MLISDVNCSVFDSSNDIKKQTKQIDPHLPPTDENKAKLLSDLNEVIEEILHSNLISDPLQKSAMLDLLLSMRSSLYIYFGDFNAAVADREKMTVDIEESDEGETLFPYENIFDLFVKGQEQAAFEELAKHMHNGISEKRTILLSLLFKAKGRPVPLIQFEDESLEWSLFNEQHYEELIALVSKQIDSAKRPWQQKEPLYVRLLCKAMLNDFKGSLEDIERILSIDSSVFDEDIMIAGLLHYLNGDEEEAKARFAQISFSRDGIEPETLLDWIYAFNEHKWQALVIENLLEF